MSIATVSLADGGKAVSVCGNYAYVIDLDGGPYRGSLRIFDITAPAKPTQVGQISGYHSSISVCGSYAFLDASIYDISTPSNPVLLGQLPGVNANDWTGNFVALSGHYAYVAQNWVGLVVFDLTDPSKPVQVGQASSGLYAWEVAVNGDYAYIAAATNCGLGVFNISNPTNPVQVASLPPGSMHVTTSGNYAYAPYFFFNALDISNPTNIAVTAELGGYVFRSDQAAVAGNYAYSADSSYSTGQASLGVYRLDVPGPLLSVAPTPTNTLVLTWPAPTIAFEIQEIENLNGTTWATLTNTPTLVQLKNQVVISAPTQTKFFRLAVSSR